MSVHDRYPTPTRTPLVADLGPQTVRVRLHARLGRAVRGHHRRRGDRGEGGDLEQIAPALHQHRQEGAGGHRRADQVDLDHPPPGLRVGVDEGPAGGDTGVGDDDVDLPEPLLDLLRDPGHRLVVGDIGVPVVAVAVQPLGDLLQRVRLQADQRHLRPARGELAGQQLPDAPRGPGDDRDLPLEARPCSCASSSRYDLDVRASTQFPDLRPVTGPRRLDRRHVADAGQLGQTHAVAAARRPARAPAPAG